MVDAWVLDVDGTLIDEITGSTLRPLVGELFDALDRAAVDIVVWSAGGAEYSQRRLDQFGLAARVASFHAKARRDDLGHWTPPSGLGPTSVFVDDRPEDLSPALDVVAVRPYLGGSPHDRGLHDALTRATSLSTSQV